MGGSLKLHVVFMAGFAEGGVRPSDALTRELFVMSLSLNLVPMLM